jgi:hypothetical protein
VIIIQAKGKAHRKIDESYIIYDGDNHEEVSDFVKPLESHVTKKKNKIQIVTPRGATSLEPGEIAVKSPGNRIEIFSQEEFAQVYTIL